MSFSRKDIIGNLLLIGNTAVKGFGGTNTSITHQRTIQWNIADNEGVSHKITIPNSFYVPTSDVRLLSPQHWAQRAKDHYPRRRGTWCATFDDEIFNNKSSPGQSN
jgi:hypothetical protein